MLKMPYNAHDREKNRGDLMRRNNKGQAAMEFLMTYGWAILVVLAAIGALAYFGVLNPGNWLPTKCTMQGGFSCVEYKVTADNTSGVAAAVYLKVQNNLGSDADTADLTISSSDCTFVGPIDMTGGGTLQNGDVWESTALTCAIIGGNDLDTGDRLRAKLTVTYQRSGETQSHEATGELTTKVES